MSAATPMVMMAVFWAGVAIAFVIWERNDRDL